ncbi:type VII secretion integral membrane protein EccD [Streptomyces griseorubiginosus]|uniref:Type VII secretion integral membrane protein EccD n=1 Tax=Streptomyces griseorubiginosus TaxID=67304 RepID=A0A101RPG8_9ACTN|nr:type VII secretion integral membrane protein EccD [Streptomyces griseorubiginosus]KUN59313.1 type VII secretion integral membrane protein EccD [Streptomyces griseorubiginosus]
MTTAVPVARTPGPYGTEVCRLTIAGPGGRADLAVPVTAPVSALLPVLLRHVPADPARPAGTWTLQRLGEPPLDLDATPQTAGLLHGDVLYLRPADDQMPELEFDDASDGVAHAVGARDDRWRPETTRRLFLALACLVLLAFAAAVPLAGKGAVVPVLYGVAAVGLGAVCTLDQRWSADRGIAVVTGLGACAFAVLTGLTAADRDTGLTAPRPGGIALGAVCGVLVAAVVLLPTARVPLAVTGTALFAPALAAFTAGLAAATGWDAARSLSVVAVAAFLFGHLAPRAALRLARVRVPQLPHNAAELQEDVEPHQEQSLTLRAAAADALLTVFTVSVALLCVADFAVLAFAGGWVAWAFPLVFSGAALLRAKSLNVVWQRVPVTFSGVLGMLSVLLSWTAAASGTGTRCALLLGLLVAAVLLLVGAWRLPHTRLLPVWGHTADVLELLTALALLPLLLQLLHVYAHVRNAV